MRKKRKENEKSMTQNEIIIFFGCKIKMNISDPQQKLKT